MNEVLTRLGLNEINGGAWAGGQIAIADSNADVVESVNPSTGTVLAKVRLAGLVNMNKSSKGRRSIWSLENVAGTKTRRDRSSNGRSLARTQR